MNKANKNNKQKTINHNEIIALPDLNTKVAELAYFKSQSRGFEPGNEIKDWLEAERELIYFGNY